MAAEAGGQVSRGACLLVLCACLAGGELFAAEARGSRSCRKWVEEKRLERGDKEMNKVPLLLSKTWFLGYVAGRAAKGKQDFLESIDNESLFLWIDKYCRDHPDGDLAGAGAALEAEAANTAKAPR